MLLTDPTLCYPVFWWPFMVNWLMLQPTNNCLHPAGWWNNACQLLTSNKANSRGWKTKHGRCVLQPKPVQKHCRNPTWPELFNLSAVALHWIPTYMCLYPVPCTFPPCYNPANRVKVTTNRWMKRPLTAGHLASEKLSLGSQNWDVDQTTISHLMRNQIIPVSHC